MDSQYEPKLDEIEIEQDQREMGGDDQGPDDGSLACERFADVEYRDRFESGGPMDEFDR